MMRDTSLDAYYKIRDEGLLSKRRFEVYEALVKHGPCTANELFRKWKYRSHITQQNIHPRLGELRERGVVEEVRVKPCEVTGRMAIVWKANGKMPVKWDKPQREECRTCGGKGYVEYQQGRLFK